MLWCNAASSLHEWANLVRGACRTALVQEQHQRLLALWRRDVAERFTNRQLMPPEPFVASVNPAAKAGTRTGDLHMTGGALCARTALLRAAQRVKQSFTHILTSSYT